MKITPEKLAFDFDGVIADIGEAFLRLACQEHGYCSFSLEEVTDFHVEKCTSIPLEVVHTIFTDIMNDSLGTGLIPLPGAIQTLEHLTTLSPLIIITARCKEEPVVQWLDHYLNRQAFEKTAVIAMNDHDNKVSHLQENNIRYFVDDRGETCTQVSEAGLTPILFRQPWNRNYTDFISVSSWQDLAALLPLEPPFTTRN